ncbi:exported protein of unknown function [Georgfuchsia toluolica]|uniref:Lysozyme inhibitor LprI-like N-terminal domain-containing protein n=1 Tax=Georgfuchsia toluolica TaxID=424218 RepID=A0A916N3A1_9PROT|nr:ankyrin repeat domain-containing protein [Georgfuchsia toluolica]CAG4884769.1 exported protein of unknown function [Georgfuchsia toluolica]
MKTAAGTWLRAAWILPLLITACAGTQSLPTPPRVLQPTRYSASFNCTMPVIPLQEVICENEALAGLDREMAQSFRGKLRELDFFGRSELLANQRRWLLSRASQCLSANQRDLAARTAPANCLLSLYRTRITELQRWPVPQPRSLAGKQHPLAAYVEFRLVDDREPALCAELGRKFNVAISDIGQVDPSRIAGLSELAGSHGPRSSADKTGNLAASLYEAGPYASYQLRAKGLSRNGQNLIDENALPVWVAQLPNAGGSFSASSSQTLDYAALDVFMFGEREFVLVVETWGYYAAAARGESPHAGVYELTPSLQPRCLFRTYLTPPMARVFERLPLYTELRNVLNTMSGEAPEALAPDERQDEVLLDKESLWTFYNMPLLMLDVVDRYQREGALRRRHDAAMEAIFTWSERNLPCKLLYRRLIPLIQPAHVELIRAYQNSQGLKPDEAVAAADLLIIETLDKAADNLQEAAPSTLGKNPKARPRYAPAPVPGDLEQGRRYTGLHSAVLNRALPEVIADFVKYEIGMTGSSKGSGPAGDTALMAAVRDPETLRQLLVAGLDANASNDWRKTALMTAAQTNQQGSAQILLDAGADPQRATIAWHAEGAGGIDNGEGAVAGRTALMYAAAGAAEPLIRLLVERGAAVSQSDATGRRACDYMADNQRLTDLQRSSLQAILCAKN